MILMTEKEDLSQGIFFSRELADRQGSRRWQTKGLSFKNLKMKNLFYSFPGHILLLSFFLKKETFLVRFEEPGYCIPFHHRKLTKHTFKAISMTLYVDTVSTICGRHAVSTSPIHHKERGNFRQGLAQNGIFITMHLVNQIVIWPYWLLYKPLFPRADNSADGITVLGNYGTSCIICS